MCKKFLSQLCRCSKLEIVYAELFKTEFIKSLTIKVRILRICNENLYHNDKTVQTFMRNQHKYVRNVSTSVMRSSSLVDWHMQKVEFVIEDADLKHSQGEVMATRRNNLK